LSTQVPNDFLDLAGWSAVASGQARLAIATDRGPQGRALRLDFDFHGGGGFVVARKELSLTLPESYAFHCRLHGAAPANKLEFKLVDPDHHNVWRYQQEAFDFTGDGCLLTIQSRQIDFAWGPAGGGIAREVGVIELAIVAGPGGRGRVWIDELWLEDRDLRSAPLAQASSALSGHAPECAIDGSMTTSWRSAASPAPQWFALDFGGLREFGGLILDWEPGAGARAFDVETSNDGTDWHRVYTAPRAAGVRSYVYLPGSESRHLRLKLRESTAGMGFGIVGLAVQPHGFSKSLNDFFQNIAHREAPGHYPKYLGGTQTYWTPAGLPDGLGQGLLNEEGMFEVDAGRFSIEPFLFLDGRLVTWADARIEQALECGDLPIPSVIWRVDGLLLRITAWADAGAGESALYLRYHLENASERPRQVRLFAALRPFQVTPPWQAFKAFGGVSPIREISYRAGRIWVNGRAAVTPLPAPEGFGATAFAQGAIAEYLQIGEPPPDTEVNDAFGCASGVLAYDLELPPAASAERYLVIPCDNSATGAEPRSVPAPGDAFDRAVAQWQDRLGAVVWFLPPLAQPGAAACRTATAHILVNRQGPALQPGPRRYTRSWIRDGAIMAAALLRMGREREARDFVCWYATYQAADGGVPCCVDADGPDPLPEHDSHGEFIYAIAECFRFTGDAGWLEEMWPALLQAVGHIEALRRQRLTPDYQAPGQRACYGLLPESVSHEGYLAHPVHAYWDDFWALRGLKDAAWLAETRGDGPQARRLAGLRDAFRETLYASLHTTMSERGIDYLPGSVEWADHDPVASASALTLVDELPYLPAAAVERTFTAFLARFRAMRSDTVEWTNYTPYEIRVIGALVRLGQRQDAQELLQFFLDDRRPRPWNQWPEIAWRDPGTPGHLGDLPHSWIGAEYVLAFHSLFAYEREADQSLVIAAGVPDNWLDEPDGIAVVGLPTTYGTLDLAIRRTGPGTLDIDLGGHLRPPPGQFRIRPPLAAPLREAWIDGRPALHFTPTEVRLGEVPARVRLRY
jgi:hypothetical protein